MPGAQLTERETGQIIALRASRHSYREIAKLMNRSKPTIISAVKRMRLEQPDAMLLAADDHMSSLTPIVPIVIGETLTQTDDKRLAYEAARDFARGRRLYTDQVNVNDISQKPTNDLVQLLTDVLQSIKSNTAIESTEAEFTVVTTETPQVEQKPSE